MPDLIRAFVAIELPDPVIVHLKSVLGRLIKTAPHGARWTALQNIHLTLKFLGNATPQALEQLETRFTRLTRNNPPFKLCMDSTGVFPNSRNPRVIWAGIRASDDLNKLHTAIELESVKSGFRPEGNTFSPHLTLGRLRDSVSPAEIFTVLKALDSIKTNPAIEFEVKTFSLFQSDLRRDGPVYTRLAQFKLTPPPNK